MIIMLKRFTITVNFSLGSLAILQSYIFNTNLLVDILIIILIFVMAVLTILNYHQWFIDIKTKDIVKNNYNIVLLSYIFVLIFLIILRF